MAIPFWWLWGCIALHLAGEVPCAGKPSHRAQLLQRLWLGHQPCSHHPGTRDATSTFKGHHGAEHLALSIKATLTRDGNQALRWTGLVCRLSLSSPHGCSEDVRSLCTSPASPHSTCPPVFSPSFSLFSASEPFSRPPSYNANQ